MIYYSTTTLLYYYYSTLLYSTTLLLYYYYYYYYSTALSQDMNADTKLQSLDLKRRNSTSTIFLANTMTTQDNDATIECVCVVIRTYMIDAAEENVIPLAEFDVFKDASFIHHHHPSPKISSSSSSSQQHKEVMDTIAHNLSMVRHTYTSHHRP